MPIQIGAKGATIGGNNYPPYAYIDWLSPAEEGNAVQGGDAFGVPARGAVSGAWNAASSGTWRPAAIGALPRAFLAGGASGGTWAISYRTAAGVVTSDPAEAIAANATDVTPVYLADAAEIMVTVTGTATLEMK